MRLSFLALVLVAVAVSGCKSGGTHSASSASASFVWNGDETLERIAFSDSIHALLLNSAYDMLDSTAADLRLNDRRFSDGEEKLRAFYVDGLGQAIEMKSEGLWARQIARLREWHALRPHSITAAVGLAAGLDGYGWHARGGGYAKTVTRDGANLFDDRVMEAWQTLEDARGRSEMCPGWYIVAHHVALAQGWPPDDCDQLFREAIAYAPGYVPFYAARAHHLLPRWYGDPGEWEHFADEATRPLSGEESDVVYARIVIGQMKVDPEIFPGTRADWTRTRNGLQTLIRRYPSSIELKSMLCMLAVEAGDLPLGHRLFEELGNQLSIGVWRTEARFLHDRELAMKAAQLASS